MNKQSVVIVGGGISGLSAAFFLSQRAVREHRPLKITVLEATDRFGGVLRTLTHNDIQMEAGADAFYAGFPDVLDLCRELGLQEDVIEAAPCFHRFFSLKDIKLFSIPGPLGSFLNIARFLSDPRLSFSAKLRMLGEPFIPRRKDEGDESLASFIRRRLGRDFYREFVKPLVQGVYMIDPEKASLEALFPKLQKAERTYGSLAGSFLNNAIGKKEKDPAKFFTLKNGLEGLVQALVRELGECELRRGAPVRQCVYNKGWEIFLENGEVLRADSLGLAMNACDSSKLLSGAAPGLSRALSAIRYDSIAAVNLICRAEEISPQGLVPGFLVAMNGEEYPFSSLKCLGKSADGKYLFLRAFLSETMNSKAFSESDEALTQKMQTFLTDYLDIQAKPLSTSVHRYPSALPQYETGHLECVAQIEKELLQYPGLFLAGNGFRGFGITDCIRQARSAVSNL
jgi:oxygen-dependent protoporphyrinogen oxidase